LIHTTDDFWKIVNKFKIKIIMNLDSGSNHYLTKQNTLPVVIVEEKTDEYIIRKIGQDIYHFQVLNWPDCNIPSNLSSILKLIEKKNEIILTSNNNNNNNQPPPPILVHCSAGCGRTGVFITVDSLIKKYHLSQSPEEFMNYDQGDLIYKLISFQRTQRISMVQTFQQYLVCYELVVLYLKLKEEEKEEKEAR